MVMAPEQDTLTDTSDRQSPVEKSDSGFDIRGLKRLVRIPPCAGPGDYSVFGTASYGAHRAIWMRQEYAYTLSESDE